MEAVSEMSRRRFKTSIIVSNTRLAFSTCAVFVLTSGVALAGMVGDTFVILTASSRSGEFSTVNASRRLP